MLKATLRSLLGHKLRLGLTAIAVVLGVAFVCGTFVLTDTLNATFNGIFTQANSGISVSVRGKPVAVAAENNGGGQTQRQRLPQQVLSTVRSVDGVATAQGRLMGQVVVLGRDGKPLPSQAPTFGTNWVGDGGVSADHLRSGHAPHGSGELLLDTQTASKRGFHVGDTVNVVPESGAVQTFTMVGTLGFGAQDQFGGATFVAFDTPTAQRLLNTPGQFDTISVASRSGVTDSALRDRISSALGGSADVITGSDAARRQSQQLEQGLSFFNTFLLIFAVVALFIGCFIIVNTFSILVVQRSREFALLRALGATRRQVLGSVLTEALITGVVASAVGVGFGLLLARGLFALLAGFGVSLPNSGLVLQARTVIIGLALGTLVTTLSAVLPARRATRVAPVAALREAVAEGQPVTLRRIIAGALLTAIGAALIAAGLFGSAGNRLAEIGAGSLVAFIGIAVLSPLLVQPVAGAIGWPAARWRGLPGRLARENAQRSPRRTASTASALMVGLALVACISALYASFNASLADQVAGVQKADFQVNPTQNNGNAAVPPAAASALRRDSRLRDVEELRSGAFQLNGDKQKLLAIDPATRAATIGIDTVSGDPGKLGDSTVLISDAQQRAHGWGLGTVLPMKLEDGTVINQRVVAVFRANQLLGDFVITIAPTVGHYQHQQDELLLVNGASGESQAQTRAAVEADLRSFPTLQAQTRDEFVKQQEGQLASLLGLILALLVLSLVIAVLGIVNTLALSIIERTRELGLLRALGLTRRQTRSMVRWEAVTIALLGAVLGIVVGTAFSAAIVQALHDQGITTFAVSWLSLILAAVFAFLAGLAAAIFPALRATRMRLLDALAAE